MSTSYNNAAGFLICFISLALGLLFKFAKTSPDDGNDWLRYSFLGILFCTGLLFLIYRKTVVFLGESRTFEIESGFWPFLRTTFATIALAEHLHVTTFLTQQGSRGYTVELEYVDGRRLRLLRTLAVRDLANAKLLSESLNIDICVSNQIRSLPEDPVWEVLGISPIDLVNP